jgi:hypothetical protein
MKLGKWWQYENVIEIVNDGKDTNLYGINGLVPMVTM